VIRSAVDQEFRTVVGIVCCHAHIYTDTVAASEELQEMTERFFRELREKLTAAGLLKADHALAGTPTREGAALPPPPPGRRLCGIKGYPAGARAGVRCTLRKGHKSHYHEHGRGKGPRVRWIGYHNVRAPK